MRTVTVPVTKDFEFEGRQVYVGEPLEVSPAQALVLHRRGVVSLDRQATYLTEAVEPEPTPEPAPVQEPSEPTTEPKKKRRRRTYKRRDLRAED